MITADDKKLLIQKITRGQIRAKQYSVKTEEVMKTRSDDEAKSVEFNNSSEEEVTKDEFTSSKIKSTNLPGTKEQKYAHSVP